MTQDNKEPVLEIQKIYLKDVSFESPGSPEVFQKTWETDLEFDLNISYRELAKDTYDVSLKLTCKVNLKQESAFLVEVDQAGIFTVSNFPQDQLEPILNSYCPNILFPYAREAISDLTTKGGFPPLLLAPINFDAVYAQKLNKQQQKANKEKDGNSAKH